ncbi:hypothetical protein CDO44_00320 [Pigmentiphaga sp. NML080357]|uniref:hypothetical protein n=1 Tax=Pigmentiphaga sp. NML080357 TaxID=2008675 RepID=UPI000B41AED9|nr:hypothetical protein [Pigmentiphaga sp. NML080357]OVZ64695.1 hypothetical protein CDO44_00320 [Pigmentiphaga sp. NML080357]
MRRHLGTLILATLLLAACGGEDQASPEARSVEDLERQGQLPVLDRSDDLGGPDADGNGVRDDIDAWIARHGGDPARQAALAQLARSFRAAVLAGGDPAAAQEAAHRNTRAVACVMARSGSGTEGTRAVAEMRKMSANTKARVVAYLAYSAALDGTVMSLPAGNGCDD